jgi:hypothetical protein
VSKDRQAILVQLCDGEHDSVVEAVIEASPSECWAALTDEAEGRITWWRPYVTLRRRGDIPADQVGSVLEVAANAHPERRIGTARWAERTVVLEPGHKKVMENFEGAFRGPRPGPSTRSIPGARA